MEFVKGRFSDEYLEQKYFIPEFISEKLIDMLKEMEQLKLLRCDPKLRQVIITNSNKIKVIDHVNPEE